MTEIYKYNALPIILQYCRKRGKLTVTLENINDTLEEYHMNIVNGKPKYLYVLNSRYMHSFDGIKSVTKFKSVRF